MRNSSVRSLSGLVFGAVLLWAVATGVVPVLRRHSNGFVLLAIALLASERLLTNRTSSGGPAERSDASGAAPPGPEAKAPPSPAASAAEHCGSRAVVSLREVRDDTEEKIGEIDQRFREERKTRQADETRSLDREKVGGLVRIAEELHAVLKTGDESSFSLASLEEMTARLKAMTAAASEDSASLREQLSPLASPEEWLRQGNVRVVDYLWYLEGQRRRAEDLLAAYRALPRSPRPTDWRADAESLLILVGKRRPLPGESDAAAFGRLHEDLLHLLEYREIPVSLGDPIDRELHQIETSRSTDEMLPNRVLRVLASGYADVRTGKVWRRATVVMSEQRLG
jgi:hypothetical protein